MKKDTYYFSHDFGARNDPKLQSVMMEHGVAGLGVFWCIIEILYEQCGYQPINGRSLKTLAFTLHTDVKMLESVIKDFGLFKYDDDNFWSESVIARLKKRDDANEARRQKRLAYIEAKKDGQLKDNSKSTASELESDLVKANKKECAHSASNRGQNLCKPLSIDEVRAYALEHKLSVDPEQFWDFYESKGWMIGKNKIKDWKACVRTWVRNNQSNGKARIAQDNGVPVASYGRRSSDGHEYC